MEYKHEQVNYKNTICKETKEHAFEMQINLPDYYPDVCRVLLCTVKPYTDSCLCEGDRINVDGLAVVRVLYASDDSSLHIYESEQRYNKTFQCHATQTKPIVDCSQKIASVHYRVISPRRMEIKAAVAIQCTLSEICEMKSFDEENISIEILTKEQEIFNITSMYSGNFTLEDSYAMKDERLVNAKTVQETIHFQCQEIKTVKDKVLLKGNILLSLLMLVENEKVFIKHSESIPFAQVLEVYGVEEDDAAECILTVNKPTFSFDDKNECKYCLPIAVQLIAGKKQIISVVHDMYSCKQDVEKVFTTNRFALSVLKLSDTCFCSTQAEKTEEQEMSFLHAIVNSITYETSLINEKLCVEGIVNINLIFSSDEGLRCYSRAVPFDYNREMHDRIFGEVVCTVLCDEISCVRNSDSYSVKLALRIDGYLLEQEDIHYVESFSMIDKTDSSSENGLISVYYAENGERVWDIAKNNRVPLHALKELNELQSDCVEEKKILLLMK